MQPDPIGVHVSLADIYRTLLEMSAKLDVAMRRIDDHDSDMKDHEARLRALEKARWPLPTISALIACASFALALVVYLNR